MKLYGLILGEMLLNHCDNLNNALQTSCLPAEEGQTLADMIVRTLSGLRAEDKFELFCAKVKKMVGDLDVSDP